MASRDDMACSSGEHLASEKVVIGGPIGTRRAGHVPQQPQFLVWHRMGNRKDDSLKNKARPHSSRSERTALVAKTSIQAQRNHPQVLQPEVKHITGVTEALSSNQVSGSQQGSQGGSVEEEEETHKLGSLSENAFSDPAGSANPLEPRQDEKRAPGQQLPTGFRSKPAHPFLFLSIPLIWGAVLLLGLLVAAVVLFAVMAKRKKGNRLDVCGRFLSSRVSGMNPSSVVHHVSDSGLAAELPLDVPYVRLDSPPSFDDTTYASLPLDSPSSKPSPLTPSSLPPLPPKVLVCSEPVTYATVIFPGGDKGGGASCGPAQNPPNNQTPSS
ncbi:Trem-like transcript 1 protein [Saguinus oedipus]|uniref:Trem-like transcript 1 protein n=1 Tax=Saguinus oedipus TaxID=9490 RepID=A0ABQ9VWB5_SAGOE|nr:Trem-like transcript 1 protein [Saguinus oedipus]